MADDSNVITQETVDAATNASNAMNLYSTALDAVKEKIESYSRTLNDTKNVLNQNQQLTEKQAHVFNALSIEVLGARTAFDRLNNIDTSGLNTFTNQYQNLKNIIQNSPLNKTLIRDSLESISKATGKVIDSDALEQAMSKGKEAVLSFAETFLTSADNGLRLQNAYLQLSAATGNLDNVFQAASPNLSNLNNLLQKQQDIVSATAKATNVPTEVVENYYSQLGSIPLALNSVVKSSGDTTKEVSMLTATIQLATGSGRKYADVVDDLRSAFRNYNISGEDALQFTARISEISGKYGIELEDVRSALRSTSVDFRMFGNEAEGASAILNQYVGALKNTGINGSVAVDIVKGMTSQLKDLTIAQKGFLSAQTGGPGGLMGAFQIEKELREGKLDKVFDRVRQTMSKQFGNIVSLEEASQSQNAAAQLTKQIMILRQGPLGQFAKSDQEAIRILESFKNVNSGKQPATTLGKDIVTDTMEKGNQISDRSYTAIAKSNSILEEIRNNTSIMSLNAAQKGFTAAAPKLGVDENFDTLSEYRDNLKQFKQNAGEKRTKENVDLNSTDKTRVVAFDSLKNVAGVIDDVKNFMPKVKEVINGTATKNENKINVVSSSPTPTFNLAEVAQTPQQNFGDFTAQAINSGNIPNTSRSQLGGIASQATSLAGTPLSKNPTPTITTVAASTNEVNGEITVHVEGFCLDCGEKIKGHNQSYSVNTAQRAKK